MKTWADLMQTRTRRVMAMAAAFLVLFVVAGMFLPAHWRVARTVIIAAPPAAVFPHINDLKKWREWTVWYEASPGMTTEYSRRTEGVGATSRWDDGSRRGALKIIASTPDRLVEYTVIFDGGDRVLQGSLRLLPEQGGGTRVVWRAGGEAGAHPLQRYVALLVKWWVGRDMERSLEKLRNLVEIAGPPPASGKTK